MGAGGAGGRNGQVGAFGAIGHRDDAGGRIQGDDGNKIRVDPVGSFVLVELGDFPLAHDHAAHAGADDDTDAMRLLSVHVKPAVGERFLDGHEGELGVAVHTFTLAGPRNMRQARSRELWPATRDR